MNKLKVKFPFAVHDGVINRHFSVGEHMLTDEELNHKFVQACIKAGRAEVLASAGFNKPAATKRKRNDTSGNRSIQD